MGLNKRYVANNLQNLQLIVTLPGSNGQSTITFNAGYGLRKEAYFITDNMELQQALEKDHRLNKSYRLEEINNMSVSEYEARRDIENARIKAETNQMMAENAENNVQVKSKEFKNTTLAKHWLNTEFGISQGLLGNKAKIVNEGLKLGIEITFSTDLN